MASLLDTRFYSSIETELLAAVRQVPEPRVAILNTATSGLGQTMGLLDILKRAFPSLPTGLCGPHPSQFPEAALALPRTDFVLAGDPEPILHSLLDFFTMETRLHRVPGLISQGSGSKHAHWLGDLNSLYLPDWQGIFLSAYAGAPGSGGCRINARLSRGHTRCPADRAFGAAREPLRIWRLDHFASCMQKATNKGLAELFLADPPGVWTPTRLDHWCDALLQVRNAIPWGLQLLPTFLSSDTISRMHAAQCRRVVFLLPSCDRVNLRKYGCILDARELAQTLRLLEQSGIQPHAEVWMGGPEERLGEPRRVVRMLGALGFPSFSLHPFPCQIEAPICKEIESDAPPPLTDWTRWALDPWNLPRPQAIWGGAEAAARMDAEFHAVIRAIEGHPGRILRQSWRALRSGQFFRTVAQGLRLRA
ncbi:MAG: hypothetical protein KJ726_11390 [Verrucomicrobia bacterium]|nr:hypothetical protein [Verrucomicrobiota bacterium]MBU1910642.1 hypothetical protein [Verrucomicrobiota bacterium]